MSIYNLDEESHVTYYKDFIKNDFSKKLFDELIEKIPWTFGKYNMYGKEIKTPRMLFCVRDLDYDVKKVYKVTDSIEWTENLLILKEMIEKVTGKKYKYAQLNYYRNGNDYIGPHTDSEVKEGDEIVSISLGATRPFRFISKNISEDGKKKKISMNLENGSMLIMNDHAAKYNWKHELPKVGKTKTCGKRINITFRNN
jgi:alkylated DNA repair dioxygenase AlkB